MEDGPATLNAILITLFCLVYSYIAECVNGYHAIVKRQNEG